MGYKIQKYHTTQNYESRYGHDQNYITIHYVGASGQAWDNARYFHSVYRGASAHYFTDPGNIVEVVNPKYAAWHCGGGLQGSGGHTYFGSCTNYNSIGIEMCIYYKNGHWRVHPDTVKRTAWLVQHLMKKYNIPAKHVIRHYDVTGKSCPACYYRGHYLLNNSTWKKFKKILVGKKSINGIKKSSKVNGNGNTKTLFTAIVTASDGLNVRKGCDVEYSRIKTLPYGTKIKVLQTRDGWYRIDKAQWVNGYYTKRKIQYKSSGSGGKSIETLAREVIAGKWGNGETRKNRLKKAGYNYQKVQDRVNELL